MEGSASNPPFAKAHVPTASLRRKYWTRVEEDALAIAAKELVIDGWRLARGWRPGFYEQVAQHIKMQIPGSDIRGEPHVKSRLTTWKQEFDTVTALLGRIGKRLDPKDHSSTIVGSQARNANVKSDHEFKKMLLESHPHYEDWKLIFGKDCAIGSTADDFSSTRQQILNNQPNPVVELSPPPTQFPPTVEDLTSDTEDATSTAAASTSRQSGSKKRKSREKGNDDPMVAMMVGYMNETTEAIRDLTKAINSLKEVDPAVTKVFPALERFTQFSIDNRVVAARKIVSSQNVVALFFSMPDEGRVSLVRSILDDTI